IEGARRYIGVVAALGCKASRWQRAWHGGSRLRHELEADRVHNVGEPEHEGTADHVRLEGGVQRLLLVVLASVLQCYLEDALVVFKAQVGAGSFKGNP